MCGRLGSQPESDRCHNEGVGWSAYPGPRVNCQPQAMCRPSKRVLQFVLTDEAPLNNLRISAQKLLVMQNGRVMLGVRDGPKQLHFGAPWQLRGRPKLLLA
eukprot:6471966-Amphidinium_carterae.1